MHIVFFSLSLSLFLGILKQSKAVGSWIGKPLCHESRDTRKMPAESPVPLSMTLNDDGGRNVDPEAERWSHFVLQDDAGRGYRLVILGRQVR